MIPLLRHFLHKLLRDEMWVRRWLRALLMGTAGGGFAFADQLAGLLNAPAAVTKIKVAAVLCGFVSVLINLGEKNAKIEAVAKDPP